MRQGFELSRAEESGLFEKATERLDIYVRLCLEDDRRDKAKEFLSDGRYVRFALKEFTEQLFTEYPWPYDISPRIDMENVYKTIAEALSGDMEVLIDPGDFYNILIAVSDEVSLHLGLHFLPGSIEVTVRGLDDDDDREWKYPVAEHLSDDFTLTLLDQHLDDPFGLTEEHMDEFCDRVSYLHRAIERIREMAGSKASVMIVRHGLRQSSIGKTDETTALTRMTGNQRRFGSIPLGIP